MNVEERLDERIRELVESEEGFVVGVEAQRFVAEQNPQALAEWLHAHAVTIASDRMQKVLGSYRQRAFHRAERRAFRQAVEYEDTEALGLFGTTFVVNEATAERKKLAQMTGNDCIAAAAPYERSGKRELMTAAFLRALAKQSPGACVVGDNITEERLEQLWNSITGEDSVPAQAA